MDPRLSKVSICEIIRVLSCEKILALQFFDWVQDNNPSVYRNGNVCSLMIDNCGRLNDYDTMRALLKRFKHEDICLNDSAFGFLPVLDSGKARSMESVSLVVNVLGEVGGSVRSSGVQALIGMLCGSDCFELADYVIEITEKKAGYYAILVREKLKRGRIEQACDVINRMCVQGCEPDTKVYNYILGSLCKNNKLDEALTLLEEMKRMEVEPDGITFEIFISSSWRLGKMEVAKETFDRGRYEEAYEFVRNFEVKKMPQVHKMFSLLARLYRVNGNLDVAARIIGEMMERGLKPEFRSYVETVKALGMTGSKDLASDLKTKFAKFRVE
ncbi:pentatricopeptide repeat-containing protein At2g18520, mitochondrial-like [Bidens hawaiensis]|uniref:pentatricopeptide repeat-containing protein At2g18520, mitochondrial-like n=1 Tax=Bidens hawaiensis TaxID=980011 RepID=UPI00404ADBA5